MRAGRRSGAQRGAGRGQARPPGGEDHCGQDQPRPHREHLQTTGHGGRRGTTGAGLALIEATLAARPQSDCTGGSAATALSPGPSVLFRVHSVLQRTGIRRPRVRVPPRQSTTNRMASNHRHLFSLSSGGWRPEIKVLAGPRPYRGGGGAGRTLQCRPHSSLCPLLLLVRLCVSWEGTHPDDAQ